MARYYKCILFTLVAFLFPLCSCQEGGDAGDLLGQWRLTGSDMKYISFSGSVAKIKSLNRGDVYGNFQHVGDSLFIQCYSVNGAASDTALIENDFGFRPFNNIRVRIEALSSDRLLLRQYHQTWDFEKY